MRQHGTDTGAISHLWPDGSAADGAGALATCKTLSYVSDADGVRGAIDGVMQKTGLPQPAAAQVVARSVAGSCPQYKPLVKQAESPTP